MVKLKGKKLEYYLRWYRKSKGRLPDGYKTLKGKKVKGAKHRRRKSVKTKKIKLTGARLKSYRKWYLKKHKHYPKHRK